MESHANDAYPLCRFYSMGSKCADLQYLKVDAVICVDASTAREHLELGDAVFLTATQPYC